ncbi:DNA ligase D [Fredinandcohnia quinoae]|uniref:DNA ligase (ATP) n=1 Tax=Fredinandcohnia quinoae TaxID=2918902 RepID=A0AAW5ECW2_9BACI|nr:DNA ligase D [Fredinandcohnia sp. SECRCQ15]MCH1627550.1 DNA ligase D [Fredinandcohnia sp. SECRCQ15]
MQKPMLPTLTFEVPIGQDWVYEIKYDGFRAILYWTHDNIELISRNGNNLNEQFPELIDWCLKSQELFQPHLPLVLDGELCILESLYKANFELIQQRGRLKNKDKILKYSMDKPAHFLVFDLLEHKGNQLSNQQWLSRKKELKQLFESLNLETKINPKDQQYIQLINFNGDYESIWKIVTENQSEGVIAKKVDSHWEAGKRTINWFKIKNWQKAVFFITGFDKINGYFHVGVLRNLEVFEIGLFSNGLATNERQALLQVIRNNATTETTKFLQVLPGICVELFYLELFKEQLRQPSFSKFCLDMNWKDCTWEKLVGNTPKIPSDIEISHPDKPLWKDKPITKQDYIQYLAAVSPYMLPFLEKRLLTVIRYPHGMYGESFYQKNCPDYAPDFIETAESDGNEYIICNDLKTLVWLGNQLSFEFHIPFQTINSTGPSEIVFDLDPPSRGEFQLAVKAALILKEVFDNLKLISFVKTSGNKGLQIYLPLPEHQFTYEQTRKFTEFIATYLTTSEPDLFTTERLKKNRGNRLYVDYVQHAEGKTIIAPYSVRGNDGAYVATPLFWNEVNENLSIENFPLESINERINKKGCPFAHYFGVKNEQPFEPVLKFLYQS